MIYKEEAIKDYCERVRGAFGFTRVEFEKQVTDDLYFFGWDSAGVRDRVRLKPNGGILQTYFEGRWRQVPFVLNNKK